MKWAFHAAPLLIALLTLVACEEPPARELAAAEAALQEAKAAGADLFAADRFEEASAALQSARRKVDAKDFRGALSAAVDANEKARAAATAVPSAKLLIRSAAELAHAEARAALDEAASVRAETKAAAAAFQGLAGRVAELERALDALAELLARDDLIAAQKAGADVKPMAVQLASETKTAARKWLEDHPKGRRPPKRS